MSGPPSRAGTCWTAAATNVPTSPTIRIEILNARFMGSSPIPRLSFAYGGVTLCAYAFQTSSATRTIFYFLPDQQLWLGGGDVDRVDVLVVVDQSVDGLLGQLEDDLVLRDHVDVDDVGVNVDELVVEHGLDERVRVAHQLRVGLAREHYGAQGPDGGVARKCLGQAAVVLGHAVQGALDLVDALERLGQPLLDL
jgi:hypothetical protein